MVSCFNNIADCPQRQQRLAHCFGSDRRLHWRYHQTCIYAAALRATQRLRDADSQRQEARSAPSLQGHARVVAARRGSLARRRLLHRADASIPHPRLICSRTPHSCMVQNQLSRNFGITARVCAPWDCERQKHCLHMCNQSAAPCKIMQFASSYGQTCSGTKSHLDVQMRNLLGWWQSLSCWRDAASTHV